MLVRKNRKKIVVGNWKMNPGNLKDAKKLFQSIAKKRFNAPNVTVVVCPPAIYLSELKKSYRGTKILFGAQDVFFEKEGAFTGQTGMSQLKDLGIRFVIIGHSERRALGETDEIVAKKVKFALQSGMHVVLCIGEKERDADGQHLKVIENQLKGSLKGVSKELVKKLIIAYEPLWAISKGDKKHKAMMPEETERAVLYLRKILSAIYNRKIAENISIIYGGSSNASNAFQLVHEGHVDGLLPGRASLNADEFIGTVTETARKK